MGGSAGDRPAGGGGLGFEIPHGVRSNLDDRGCALGAEDVGEGLYRIRVGGERLGGGEKVLQAGHGFLDGGRALDRVHRGLDVEGRGHGVLVV